MVNKWYCGDSREGLASGFNKSPVYMKHFHQQTIIRRYLTQNSRAEAIRELRSLSL